MITVACVLRSGGIYDETWVDRLQRAVTTHMRAEHRFVCLTDTMADNMLVWCGGDITWLPFEHDWPGWWSKLNLFALPGKVLYLDLDVAVVGSLDALLDSKTRAFDGRSFEPEGTLIASRDFYQPRQFNSSVLLFENRRDIYRMFVDQADAVMKEFRGDQEWLSVVVPESKVWLSGIVSYKKHCRARLHMPDQEPASIPPPAGTSVVAFHGQPKMMDAEGWPKEYWAA